MLLADFSSIQNKKTHNVKKNSSTNSQSKHPNPSPPIQPSTFSPSQPQQSTIQSYLKQLGIQNVPEIYFSSKKQQQSYLLNKTLSQQATQKIFQQTIQRLYKGESIIKNKQKQSHQQQTNLINPNNSSNHQQQNNYHPDGSDQINNSKKNVFYNELYPEQKDYDKRFMTRNLQKELTCLRVKLMEVFIEKWKSKNRKFKDSSKRNNHKNLTNNSNHNANITKNLQGQQLEQQQTAQRQKIFIRSIILFLLTFIESSSEANNNNQKNNQKFPQPPQTNNNQTLPFSLQQYKKYIDSPSHSESIFGMLENKNGNHRQKDTRKIKQIQIDEQMRDKIIQIAQKIIFGYYFLKFQLLQKELKNVGQRQANIRNLNDIENFIWQNRKIPTNWELIYEKFHYQPKGKFTVPYQTKLYQVKDYSSKEEKKDEQFDRQQAEQIVYQSFKANAIPKSTYQKPKQRPKSSKRQPTKPIPFNFDKNPPTFEKSPTADDYYNNKWNRNFKAKSVPKSNYQQPQLSKFDQKQKKFLKKQHIQNLLKTSQFPKTMKYLQNYQQYQQQRNKELFDKYFKNRQSQREEVKEIPNFQKIHKTQLYNLEKRKQENRTNTKPVPFKFSETKNKTMKDGFHHVNNDKNNQTSLSYKKPPAATSSNMPLAKSTAKFQAYVQLRKQQRQQKLLQKQQQTNYKKRKQQDLKQYKQILKKRIQNQLSINDKANKNPYNNSFQNGNNNNVLKVDLQNIYINKPLLMSSTDNKFINKNNKKIQDDQKTYFTDNYQPII